MNLSRRKFLRTASGLFIPTILHASPGLPFYASLNRQPSTSGGGVPSVCNTLDWLTRAQNNGAPAPTLNTFNALCAFENNASAQGVLSKLKAYNAFVPDSAIAALTPQRVGAGGTDPWTITNPAYNGTTANGWAIGLASDPWITSMVNPNVLMSSLNDMGIVIYAYDATSASSGFDFGIRDTVSTDEIIFFPHYIDGNSAARIGQTLITVAYPGNGYFSCQRTSSTSFNMYWANSTHPHASIASNSTANSGSLANLNCSMGFPERVNCAANTMSNRTFSFFALTAGMTAGESATLYGLVQTLRTSLGGGTI